MRFFNLHTHQSGNNPDVLELVNQYPWEFDESVANYSVGIHPWHISENRVGRDLQFIEKKITDKRCLAIGECGLDKRIDIPFDLQVAVFEKQLLLAQKHGKPVVIHCVAAFSEAIAIRKRLKISVPMIIHGFSKNGQTAKQLLDNGFYLSFGKYLLRNPELEPVFINVPDNRFFLETDMIEETIGDVYALAAKYKGIPLEQLQQTVAGNFNTVFNTKL